MIPFFTRLSPLSHRHIGVSICVMMFSSIGAAHAQDTGLMQTDEDVYIIVDGVLVKQSEAAPLASTESSITSETSDNAVTYDEQPNITDETFAIVDERIERDTPTLHQVVNQTIDPEYQACVKRIYRNPKDGRYMALRWISDGGGHPAHHCAAVADIANNTPNVAGARLEALADRQLAFDPSVSAKLYIQAAESFATGRRNQDALRMINKAYEIAPNHIEITLVATRIYALADEWPSVVNAINQIEKKYDLTPKLYVLRAKAHLHAKNHKDAAQDVYMALQGNPYDIDALVLRGELVQHGIQIDVEITE